MREIRPCNDPYCAWLISEGWDCAMGHFPDGRTGYAGVSTREMSMKNPCKDHRTLDEMREIMDMDFDITIQCPLCKREQKVSIIRYGVHTIMGGHPYTCGSDDCPSHTVMEVKRGMFGMVL